MDVLGAFTWADTARSIYIDDVSKFQSPVKTFYNSIPETVKQLQHFLGCGNWLRNFILDYGVLSAPLHKLVAAATANAGKLKWNRNIFGSLSWQPLEDTKS